MKKSKLLLATLALGLIAAPILSTGDVYAAESDATVEFTAPTDTVAPVDHRSVKPKNLTIECSCDFSK